MFQKPIRIKSNTQLKNTEKKVLKNKIIQNFSSVTDNDYEKLCSAKDPVFISKIITNSNATVLVYLVKKRPILFEYEDKLYPTIYLLWHFPNCLPCFQTHSSVLPKLSSGADLMLPGVVLPDKEGPSKYGRFEKGTLVAVSSTDNKAPFAIGTTAHSSMDMYMAAGRGKCVNILHCFGDHLCQIEGNVTPIPELGPPDWLIQKDDQETTDLNNSNKVEDELNLQTDTTDIIENSESAVIVDDVNNMDNLLTYCFLKVLKYSEKKITLPILTSNFYRLHILTACPIGKHLDIKKTSYKKLSKFLSDMKNQNILQLKEQPKGVETIVSINFQHPLIISFVKNKNDVKLKVFESNTRSGIDVEETYTITTPVLPIFADAGLRKGDAVKPAEVRGLVTEYVKKRKLNSLDNRGIVIPNKELSNFLKSEANISWEELMQKIFKAMSSSYKINNAGAQVTGKGKIEPIVITIGSRSGNKKVTLIDNLELFGINIQEFSKECQHGVAASTSITKPEGKKCEQLLVQGNQVAFIGKLLTGKYNVPKRFIRGLELAVKNKK